MAEDGQTFEPTVARRTPKRRRVQTKFLVGGALFAVAVAYLIFSAAQASGVYYLTIAEAHNGAAGSGQVRVSGKVAGGSITYDAKTMVANFTMYDGAETMLVTYKGVLPDGFQADAEVIAEGRYVAGQPFQAKAILTKCPSKYESVQAAPQPQNK